MTRVMNEPCRSFFGRGAAAALAVSAAATLAWNAGAAWGLRYEVSKDGVDWSTSVAANPGETVQFRMLSYFDIGTKITTADGTGNARALNRFTGQQQVLGMLAGDSITNPAIRLLSGGSAAIGQVTGNLIGGTGITSFASQLFLGDLPNPPETSVAILRGYINIGQISTQRILTISNKQFGSGNTAGLTFYHDASLSNKQSGAPAASEGPPVHINATILVSGIPCPPISFQSIDSNSPAQPSGVATLSVSSTGGTAIHWLKDGVPLTNGGRISGAETPTLTINPPTASDAGSYRAQVSNDCGNMKVSGPAMLEVACTADLDRDGLVADSDFVYFVHAYDQFLCPAEPAACAADLNADHFVDDLDFQAFVVQYDALVCP